MTRIVGSLLLPDISKLLLAFLSKILVHVLSLFSRFLFVWDLALFEVVNAGDQNAQVSFSKTYNQQIGKRNTIYWVSGITENKR